MNGKSVLFIINDRDWRRALKESKVVEKLHHQVVSDCAHAISMIVDPTRQWDLIVTQETTDELREAARRRDPQPPMLIITSRLSEDTAAVLIRELEAAIARALDT